MLRKFALAIKTDAFRHAASTYYQLLRCTDRYPNRAPRTICAAHDAFSSNSCAYHDQSTVDVPIRRLVFVEFWLFGCTHTRPHRDIRTQGRAMEYDSRWHEVNSVRHWLLEISGHIHSINNALGGSDVGSTKQLGRTCDSEERAQ